MRAVHGRRKTTVEPPGLDKLWRNPARRKLAARASTGIVHARPPRPLRDASDELRLPVPAGIVARRARGVAGDRARRRVLPTRPARARAHRGPHRSLEWEAARHARGTRGRGAARALAATRG